MDAALIRAQGWTGSLLAPSPAPPGQGVLAVEPYFEDKLSAGSFDAMGTLHSLPIVNDRYTHRNRWVRAMRKTDIPMRLIDGPADPNSGRHMAQRYLEVIPNPDVVMLDDNIGHWPQIEAPDAVLAHFLAHVERVIAG